MGGRPAKPDEETVPDRPTHAEDLPAGATRALVVSAGRALRITSRGARPNVSVLVFNARDPLERLNVPDTLKAQHTSSLRPPVVLMSDMGRALATITASSLDWHDALCGHLRDDDMARYGPSSYATDGNAWRRSAREGFLRELAKAGLGRRDLHANVNLFSRVVAADDASGTLTFDPDHAGDGDWVVLRVEMDVLFILANVPHPLDLRADWDPAPVELRVDEARPRDAGALRDEGRRALAQTDGMVA